LLFSYHLASFLLLPSLSSSLFSYHTLSSVGSDPATFELIQKIQTLQRRLISKTEEVKLLL
jgi:hypothetical protein